MASLTLRIAEALTKDVGHGFVRLDPKDLDKLSAQVGDILAIDGQRRAVAKAMPTYTEHRGKGVAQIDVLTQSNAAAGLDDTVKISRIASAPAARLVLRPLDAASTLSSSDGQYVGRLLEGLPVLAGDRVRATLLGTHYQDFEVVSARPAQGALIVDTRTQIVVEDKGAKTRRKGGLSYEEVGGLRKELRRVREMVELPIKYPEIFARLGIDAPKGVLLYGPPGTGKTLLARAVAHETEAAFMTVSGPEIIHKFYGESEAKLRDIFEKARKNAPCIIFLDEIEAIAPKRENVQGDVEKRVVAQLLALMDGLESRGQIIVIGATNLPNVLDPALRRPGRFDREIEIGVPDASGRRQILDIHTRGMPLGSDVDLGKLAGITHGFVGSDLEALCREAAMTTLRSVIPEMDFSQPTVPHEKLLALQVTMEHFLSALGDIEPSAIRESFAEIPDTRWDDIGGLDTIKRELREAVEWPFRYPELLTRLNIRPPKGILLFGPPGTGKTLLAKATASQSGVNFIAVKGPALLSKFIGESEKSVRDIFKKARQAAPCILFFDEFDALAPARGSGVADSRVTERVAGQLVTEIDGVEELKGVLVVAATNRRDILDPALIRPGRFDLTLEVPLPDIEARTQIFALHLRNKPLAPDVDCAALAERAKGLSGAHIEAICQRAARHAMRDFLGRGADKVSAQCPQVTTRHLHAAIADFSQPLSVGG